MAMVACHFFRLAEIDLPTEIGLLFCIGKCSVKSYQFPNQYFILFGPRLGDCEVIACFGTVAHGFVLYAQFYISVMGIGIDDGVGSEFAVLHIRRDSLLAHAEQHGLGLVLVALQCVGHEFQFILHLYVA